MYSRLVEEVIEQVVKIFTDAEVQDMPSEKEVREEFEIIDKIYIDKGVVAITQYKIAQYLDKRWAKYNQNSDDHVRGYMAKWNTFGTV
jgi:hypothetical protein